MYQYIGIYMWSYRVLENSPHQNKAPVNKIGQTLMKLASFTNIAALISSD